MSYMPKSKSDVHITPDRVYDIIEEKWGYTKDQMFDPCPVNPQWDGRIISWKPINFVNPPYGHYRFNPLITQFIDKAITESMLGKKSIMLLPSKTDQSWFHEIVRKGYEILWIEKRLRFKNALWDATQPHFLVMIA